jgi:hypothetical protein
MAVTHCSNNQKGVTSGKARCTGWFQMGKLNDNC